MPSWNIHTAHVERLFADHAPKDLGITDANTFLFGNFAPDIYVGFMVPDVSFRIDYCTTHLARISLIPVADADLFWNLYIAYRTPTHPIGLSLVLGAWAHLVADRYYNGNFRTFWHDHDVPGGDEQRIRKQGDFDLFGHYLGISSRVDATPELMQAAYDFKPYRILAEDVERSIIVADDIVRKSAQVPAGPGHYQLLDEKWLTSVFEACNERIVVWLQAWQELLAEGRPILAADVRERAGLPRATRDTNEWMVK
jgi:hypothetical protein